MCTDRAPTPANPGVRWGRASIYIRVLTTIGTPAGIRFKCHPCHDPATYLPLTLARCSPLAGVPRSQGRTGSQQERSDGELKQHPGDSRVDDAAMAWSGSSLQIDRPHHRDESVPYVCVMCRCTRPSKQESLRPAGKRGLDACVLVAGGGRWAARRKRWFGRRYGSKSHEFCAPRGA